MPTYVWSGQKRYLDPANCRIGMSDLPRLHQVRARAIPYRSFLDGTLYGGLKRGMIEYSMVETTRLLGFGEWETRD